MYLMMSYPMRLFSVKNCSWCLFQGEMFVDEKAVTLLWLNQKENNPIDTLSWAKTRLSGPLAILVSLSHLQNSSSIKSVTPLMKIWEANWSMIALKNLLYSRSVLSLGNVHSYILFTHAVPPSLLLPVSNTAGCRSRRPCGCVVST